MKNVITVLVLALIVGFSSSLLANNKSQTNVVEAEDNYVAVDDTAKKKKKGIKERINKAKKNAERLSKGSEESGSGESKLTVNEEGTEEKSGERKKK